MWEGAADCATRSRSVLSSSRWPKFSGRARHRARAIKKLAQGLASPAWEGDLQPALAVCELFDFLEELQFWVKDRAGHYRWMNLACLLNFALNRREEVLGKTDFDLSPARIATQFRADDELVLTGGRVINRVELIGRFDHSARWFVTFKLPLVNRRGKVIGTAGIARPL